MMEYIWYKVIVVIGINILPPSPITDSEPSHQGPNSFTIHVSVNVLTINISKF